MEIILPAFFPFCKLGKHGFLLEMWLFWVIFVNLRRWPLYRHLEDVSQGVSRHELGRHFGSFNTGTSPLHQPSLLSWEGSAWSWSSRWNCGNPSQWRRGSWHWDSCVQCLKHADREVHAAIMELAVFHGESHVGLWLWDGFLGKDWIPSWDALMPWDQLTHASLLGRAAF